MTTATAQELQYRCTERPITGMLCVKRNPLSVIVHLTQETIIEDQITVPQRIDNNAVRAIFKPHEDQPSFAFTLPIIDLSLLFCSLSSALLPCSVIFSTMLIEPSGEITLLALFWRSFFHIL